MKVNTVPQSTDDTTVMCFNMTILNVNNWQKLPFKQRIRSRTQRLNVTWRRYTVGLPVDHARLRLLNRRAILLQVRTPAWPTSQVNGHLGRSPILPELQGRPRWRRADVCRYYRRRDTSKRRINFQAHRRRRLVTSKLRLSDVRVLSGNVVNECIIWCFAVVITIHIPWLF